MRTRKTLGPKPVIGLVGGIGCGKSLVARLLGQLGCAVVDADALAHDALQTAAVRDELTAWWGSGILSLDGTVSRKAVGRKVFGNPSELKRLEGVIHPFVNAARRELRNQYTADPKVLAIVEDCPLLLETGLDRQCDVLIYVSATRANRLRRLAETRGWDESELDGREKNQLPLDKKEMVADYTIDNNAGEEECLLQVRRVFSKILQDLA